MIPEKIQPSWPGNAESELLDCVDWASWNAVDRADDIVSESVEEMMMEEIKFSFSSFFLEFNPTGIKWKIDTWNDWKPIDGSKEFFVKR